MLIPCSKRTILALVSLLMLTGLISVQAQSVDPCFGLTPENCVMIGQASSNTLNALNSFNHSFTLDVALKGLEALDLGTDFELHVTGQGSFNRASINADFPFSLELGLDADLESDTSQQGKLHLKLVDGIVYLENATTETWRGLALQDALNSPQLAAFNFAASPLATLNLPATVDNNGSPLEAINALLTVPGFITYVRLEDVVREDMTLSPFSFQLDFRPLFQSSMFQTALDDVLKYATGIGPETQNMALIAPLLLQNSDLKVNLTQFVNPSDDYIYQLTLDINGVVDLNPLMGTSGDTALDPVTLVLHFEVDLSNLNQAQPVIAPAEFQLLSLEAFGIR